MFLSAYNMDSKNDLQLILGKMDSTNIFCGLKNYNEIVSDLLIMFDLWRSFLNQNGNHGSANFNCNIPT